MANGDEFLEIRGEHCVLVSVIRGIFPSMNTFLYMNFLNHFKLIFHLGITSIE